MKTDFNYSGEAEEHRGIEESNDCWDVGFGQGGQGFQKLIGRLILSAKFNSAHPTPLLGFLSFRSLKHRSAAWDM